ncbi:MAG: hypothetical protein WCJ64_02495 [Rhodospirillaceae bacterium]
MAIRKRRIGLSGGASAPLDKATAVGITPDGRVLVTDAQGNVVVSQKFGTQDEAIVEAQKVWEQFPDPQQRAKFENFASCLIRSIDVVSTTDRHSVILINRGGKILTSYQCDDEEEAQRESSRVVAMLP